MAPNPRHQILLKELDLIRDGVKNLDDIIYKNKNFAFLIWGGSLFLIADQLSQNEALAGKIHWMIYATALIPLAFWIAHVFWQQHLYFMAQREKKIAYFINSPEFLTWCEDEVNHEFPVYDHVGWVFTTKIKNEAKAEMQKEDKGFLDKLFSFLKKKQEKERKKEAKIWNTLKLHFKEEYLIDQSTFSWWSIFIYKDAKVYYLLMMILSAAFGYLYKT